MWRGMDASLLNLLGATASTISVLMFFPQAIKTWTHRNDPVTLEGVSIQAQVLILVNATLWAVYGIGSGALWTVVPSFVNFPLAVFVMVLLARARSATKLLARTYVPIDLPADAITPDGLLCDKYIAPAGARCVQDSFHKGPCSPFRVDAQPLSSGAVG